MTNPNPDDINDYYYNQGPPVVTYYAPPDPYSYLYSWVAYPFWSTGFYFPGYFVLNNFHRSVYFNQQSYFVSHHAGSGVFPSTVSFGPGTRTQSGYAATGGGVGSNWFANANAQAGAREIVAFNQNRHENAALMNESRPSSAPYGNQEFVGNNAVGSNQAGIQNRPFQSTPYSGRRVENQQAYVRNTPGFYSQPTFSQDRVFRSPRLFGGNISGGFENNGGFGGFHHGGGFGGFQGGGNFMGHGGGSGGGHGHR